MRVFAWLLNIVLFLVVLAFALSNTATSELRFFVFGDEALWRAPLVIFLLTFFVGGVVVGMMFTIPSYFRQRREISRLKRDLKVLGLGREPSVVVESRDPAAAEATAVPARIGG